jgi:HSP20 family protein
MALRKDKKDKMIVRPKEKGEITSRRPYDLWSDIDQLFDSFRTDFDSLFWPWEQRSMPLTTTTHRRTPPMDVADMGDHYVMQLEMPGIPKDRVNIEVTPNGVEIKADYDENKEEKGKNWLRRECSNMSFYRALELPEELKTDNVEAELKDGVLTINLPKVEPKPEYKAKKSKSNKILNLISSYHFIFLFLSTHI